MCGPAASSTWDVERLSIISKELLKKISRPHSNDLLSVVDADSWLFAIDKSSVEDRVLDEHDGVLFFYFHLMFFY